MAMYEMHSDSDPAPVADKSRKRKARDASSADDASFESPAAAAAKRRRGGDAESEPSRNQQVAKVSNKRKADNGAQLEPEAPPAKKSKFDDIITILVGRTEPPATIFIHRHLITSQSTFFANALRTQPSGAQWSESIESTVSLPDFELEDVELFVEFLFANPVGDWPCEALPLSLRDITNWGLFANAVVLAHYIDAPCFRDALQAALDRTQARYRKRSNVQGVSKLQPKEIDKIWTSTPPGCRARHSIVSMFILQASSVSGISEEGKEMIADLPAEACAYALQISLGIIGRSHVDAWAYSRKEDND